MSGYILQNQDVSARLDFDHNALSGSTRLVFQSGGTLPRQEGADINDQLMLALRVPAIEHAEYRRVIVNGTEARFHLARTIDPSVNPDAVNRSCSNVDLLTFDAVHVSAEPLCDSILYIEVLDNPSDLSVELQFEYSHLDNIGDDVRFSRHWLLPRCSTSYKQYSVFTTRPERDRWFPSAMVTPNVGVVPDCVYRIEVTVPKGYSAICGLPMNRDAESMESVPPSDDTETYRYKWTSSQHMGAYPVQSFALYAGEFEFWNGNVIQQRMKQSDSDTARCFLEDEDCLEEYSRTGTSDIGSANICYVTLKGFGFLLEPTNIVTSQCLDTYRKILELEYPTMVYMLFLPLRPFQNGPNLAAQIRTQTNIDIKRCTGFTGSESYLHMTFLEPLLPRFQGLYHCSGGNMVILSIDALHSYSDIDHDPRCLDYRQLIMHGLAGLFTLGRWVNPSCDMHLDLILQSYLIDQFIKRNMGHNDLKARLWACREALATVTELFGDVYPLCQRKGSPVSSDILLSSSSYVLKSRLIPSIMEGIFNSTNFLPDNFFIQALRRRLLALNAHMGRPLGEMSPVDNPDLWINGNTFWSAVADDIVRRYINVWNAKPPNRLVLQNQIDPRSKLDDILRRGVEHDHLNTIMKQYNSTVHSFIYGTGCPQMNVSFSLQLQRKGTSMDHLNFRVDIKSLQPPADINKDGISGYSLCKTAKLAVRNLYETYDRLAVVLQLQERLGSQPSAIFERVVQLYGISDAACCYSNPPALDFGDIANPKTIAESSEAGTLRRNMSLFQMWHDPVDLVGRDGNFLMGFGYIGPFPHGFCLGNGPIYDCVELLSQHYDVHSIIDTYVDNGSTYCGGYKYKNGYERLMGRGSLPVASNGGLPYWQLVHQQGVMIHPEEYSIPLSAGFSKQWISHFKIDIVEDDGVRENVKMIGDMVPISYKVNPRAERGRKKVALKGVPEKDPDEVVDDSQRKSDYIGHHSQSDKLVIDWMKMLFIGMHPELSQLDNRSVVAKVCSKVRLPLLWVSADSGFRLLARIRRCQSSGMWEQQLLSDNNIYSQLESAAALGQFGRSLNYDTSDNPIASIAVTKLELMMRRHRIHPAVRARCAYSLACLHNRDPRLQGAVQGVFNSYFAAFFLNNTSANYWHPSEARFMLDFFRALALLRNRLGYSPQMVVDMLSKALESMNGFNYMVHATNIVECCSYLSVPTCILKHAEEQRPNCLDLKRLWQLLWHLFRLDGIPGSGSRNRVLSAAFLRCISRQPVCLELCNARFISDSDIGFEFDFHYFIPLRDNVYYLSQKAFELGQTYYSNQVHIAAIESLLRLLCLCSHVVTFDDENGGIMRMQKVGFPEQLQRIHAFAGILEATRCCIALCERLIEKDLVSHAWESFGNVVEELSQSHPVLFINMDCDNSVVIRDLLYEQMRPRAASNRYYNVQIFIHIRSIINLLFGPGRLSESDPAPDQSLVTQHIESVTSGLSMPKIATFRRMYGDGARSGSTNWIEVAVEAIGALMELPQARWFIHNPELSLVGYRSMVKHPMWFSKIEEKARGGQYTMPMQFKADIALVFKNARIVNKADSLPYADSIFVEGQFDTLWPAIVRTFQRNAKGPVPK